MPHILAPSALAPPLAPTAGPKNKLPITALATDFLVSGVLESSTDRKLIQTPSAGHKNKLLNEAHINNFSGTIPGGADPLNI